MKKSIRYVLLVALVLTIGYNSVYFKKLDEVNAGAAKTFDAPGYAATYFYKQLPAESAKAPEIGKLISFVKSDAASTFKTYGHALAIGTVKYFLVNGQGHVTNIDDNGLTVLTPSGSSVLLATGYVYGNAVRDASGLVDVNKFTNTMDLNNISAEVDKIIRSRVLPGILPQVTKGSHVQFTGAIALNQAHLQVNDIEVTPISLKLIP
jgi:predicted lipoprotein